MSFFHNINKGYIFFLFTFMVGCNSHNETCQCSPETSHAVAAQTACGAVPVTAETSDVNKHESVAEQTPVQTNSGDVPDKPQTAQSADHDVQQYGMDAIEGEPFFSLPEPFTLKQFMDKFVVTHEFADKTLDRKRMTEHPTSFSKVSHTLKHGNAKAYIIKVCLDERSCNEPDCSDIKAVIDSDDCDTVVFVLGVRTNRPESRVHFYEISEEIDYFYWRGEDTWGTLDYRIAMVNENWRGKADYSDYDVVVREIFDYSDNGCYSDGTIECLSEHDSESDIYSEGELECLREEKEHWAYGPYTLNKVTDLMVFIHEGDGHIPRSNLHNVGKTETHIHYSSRSVPNPLEDIVPYTMSDD